MDKNKKSKVVNGYSTDYPIRDELYDIFKKLSPEEIKELMEAVIPKLLDDNKTLPIISGTSKYLPPFKESELNWSNLEEYEPLKNKKDE